jgi:hypothetical protein
MLRFLSFSEQKFRLIYELEVAIQEGGRNGSAATVARRPKGPIETRLPGAQ